ncbi:MCE family protein [Conexibacter sp. W3-3-2]|uniref:MlaD family protein n=1 Tax=Conexibacter sp. W3-3-2 TaxID=2675227 RepID=UPI0012B7A14C|nr:MlaD family protein [Conexibacter sp. W3-3-2]MTD42771.1 MCE family protein [Conexibacter sp. W3-3-2]
MSRSRGFLPVRLARGAWSFIDPQLKAGRIPLTRTMFLMLVAAACVFVGYTLVKKNVQLPFTDEPYYVEMVMPDARGLLPSKEPAVGVAGVAVGKVVKATVENGQARLRLRLEPQLKGKIFRNASAFVRPTSILQTLIVNISPGDPRTGALPDDQVIPASRTGGFVAIDDLTGILDPGTQAQVQVVLNQAADALGGREKEIRRIFTKLGRLTDGVTPLAQALAERRRLLSSLTVNLEKLTRTTGDRGRQLAAAVDLGSRTLAVTQRRAPELEQTTRELAPTLRQTQATLASTRRLAGSLVPALDALNPVTGKLAPTADKLRTLTPELDRFLASGKRVIDVGATPVGQLAEGLRGQEARVRRDQIPALQELGRLSQLLFDYRNGIVQTAVNLSGAVSTVRNAGPAANVKIVKLELPAGGLGLTAAQARQRVGSSTRLGVMLAKMLEYSCRDGSRSACGLRFQLPGLPRTAQLKPRTGTGG